MHKIELKFAFTVISYGILGLILFRFYQYQTNPDGIAYIGIAKNYLKLDFVNAINGYWPSLFSWLLVPFLALGIKPLLAVKVMSLLIGIFTVAGIGLLSYRFEMPEDIRDIILFISIPCILYFALSVITPDLLSACLLIYYLHIIFDPSYSDRPYAGALCGLIGGIAYLSKHYILFFFIMHFLLVNFFYYLRSDFSKKKKVIKTCIFGLVVFFVISGSWILAVSNKYKKICIASAFKYTYTLAGPSTQAQGLFNKGFLSPPNQNAIVMWDDPSYSTFKMVLWNPFQSRDYFKHQLNILVHRIKKTIRIYMCFSLVSPIILLVSISLILFKRLILYNPITYLLITLIIYTSAYLLVAVQERYLWINFALLTLMGGYLLSLVFQNRFFNPITKRLILTFFILSFAVIPMRLIKTVATGNYVEKNLYDLSKKLEDKYHIHGNIASNDNWGDTLALAYYLNSKYYGVSKRNISNRQLKNELMKYGIDYYFAWNKPIRKNSFLSNYCSELTNSEIPDLRIYVLKK